MISRKGAGHVPLGERLAQVEAGLPSDERYGAHLKNALTQLLVTPLETLFEQDDSALRDMTGYLTQARALLESGDDPPGDADGGMVIHVLRTAYALSFYGSPESISLKGRMLLCLAHQLVRPPAAPPRKRGAVIPLQERFASAAAGGKELDERLKTTLRKSWDGVICQHVRANEFPILQAPLSHYLYAASKVLGSDHPLRFYQENYDFDTAKFSKSTAFMVKWALGELPGTGPSKGTGDDIACLYDLLVEPLFPSAEQAV